MVGSNPDYTCTGGQCEDGNVDQSCKDVHYGDGKCDLQLDCAVPDIDCFSTFERDADAATWFTDIEKQLAAEESRAPRVILPETDPRFQRARALLDRGWAAFRTYRPVGELRDRRPALVLLEDPTPNAFVMPDLAQNKSAFSIQVQTGLFAKGADDSAYLGVMMHEFQHAVGLHLIGNRREQLRKYYVADGTEPIGRDQADDPKVREAALAWRAGADAVAFLDNDELGGFPLAGQFGQLLKSLTGLAVQQNPTGCARATGLLDGIRRDLRNGIDLLDLQPAIDLAPLRVRILDAETALRDECMAGFPTFVDTVAEMTNQTADQVKAQLPSHDLALVDGLHVIDGIWALTEDRRAAMRASERAFTQATGRPWSALRYFSVEEDADDTSVTVLRGASVDPAGLAKFLPSLFTDDATSSRCDALIDAKRVPPYGADLSDDHHATCWRIFHVHAYADQGPTHATPRARVTGPVAHPAIPDSIRLPDRISDHVMY